MHIGSWVIAANGSTVKVFSPWFPRGGDNAVFTHEKVADNGSGTFTVTVVHKNKEEIGNGTSAGATWTNFGTSFYRQKITQLKELIRFQFQLAGDGGGDASVLYRMLAPTWYNDAQ